MKNLDIYLDRSYTQLFKSAPLYTLDYSTFNGTEHSVEGADGKRYVAIGGLDGDFAYFTDVSPILGGRYTFSTDEPMIDQTFYCKNGLSFKVTMDSTDYSTCSFNTIKIGSETVSQGTSTTHRPDTTTWVYAVQAVVHDMVYYGFVGPASTPGYDSTVSCIFMAPKGFWESAFRPPYNYGSEPDPDGGNGSGEIPGGDVTRSATPSGFVPTGGSGMHWYKVSASEYQKMIGFLWGYSTSDMHTLSGIWEMVQNKWKNTFMNPFDSIIACYTLPTIFMDNIVSGASERISLAGTWSSSTGNPVAHQFIDKSISFDTLTPPFGSWLDYAGVTCKIFVPACGEILVPAEKILGRSITMSYRCDVYNGNICCFVRADGRALAELSSNVAYSIPIVGGRDFVLPALGAVAGATISIAAAAATGGASAAGTAALGAGSSLGGSLVGEAKTYAINTNLAGSVNSCSNGIAYVEFVQPCTAYPYKNSAAYLNAYGLPAVSAAGELSDFTGGWGTFEVVKGKDTDAGYGCMYIPNATAAEKEDIIRKLREGVIV